MQHVPPEYSAHDKPVLEEAKLVGVDSAAVVDAASDADEDPGPHLPWTGFACTSFGLCGSAYSELVIRGQLAIGTSYKSTANKMSLSKCPHHGLPRFHAKAGQ